jgi:hypothetical protein
MAGTGFSNGVDGIVSADGFSGPPNPAGVTPPYGPATFGYGIVYSTTDNITAHAGGGQANATQLTSLYNRVTTVATAGDSVKLLAGTLGQRQAVRNDGANPLAVFPPTGGTINNGAANASITVAVGAQADLVVYTGGAYRGPINEV